MSGPAAADIDDAVAFTAPGGWRVVVAPRPDSTTVALRWLVAAGGRHDGSHPGLSRLTERLVYRATARGRRDLLAAVEALGGEAVSQTTREYAEFVAVAPASERQALLALVPALARRPLLSARALAAEKVALLGNLVAPPPPTQALWDLLLQALWGTHPLAQPPGGTLERIARLTPGQIARHHAARYGPSRAVLAVAGACTTNEVRAVAEGLPLWSPGADILGQDAQPPVPCGSGTYSRWVAGDVAHVAVGVAVPGMAHPHRSALRLLDILLGRGGSSRLYRELRLRRQLAYTCHSVYMPYADVGVLAVQAVCAPAEAERVAALLADALLAPANAPPDEAEIAAARQRYAGSLARSFETNASLTSIMGVETLLAVREPFAASAARVAAVTPAEVAAVARAYLAPSCLVRAILSPLAPRAAEP